jgi:hypothetical protein
VAYTRRHRCDGDGRAACVAQVAEDTERRDLQAEACSNMGVIYNAQGMFAQAVKSFDQAYDLTRSLLAMGEGACRPRRSCASRPVGECVSARRVSSCRRAAQAQEKRWTRRV